MIGSDTRVTFNDLCGIIRKRGSRKRSFTAIAGAPASGKSTLADRLSDDLNKRDVGSAAVFPMDGYHFDDHILSARGWQHQKGAPHTFDVHGFAQMLARLHRNEEDEIAVPVFDREIEISRNSARLIARTVRHLIVEGNYLLLDQPPWTDVANLFDTTVLLEVPMETLRDRLLERWKELPAEEQRAKLEDNDLPNARLVVSGCRHAEFVMMP